MAGRRTKTIQQIVAHPAAGNSATPAESPSAQQDRQREAPTRGAVRRTGCGIPLHPQCTARSRASTWWKFSVAAVVNGQIAVRVVHDVDTVR